MRSRVISTSSSAIRLTSAATICTRLQREVREHEPHVALFSPEDELAIYRRLVGGAEQMLNPGGYLIMEVGLGMDEECPGAVRPGMEKTADESRSSRNSPDRDRATRVGAGVKPAAYGMKLSTSLCGSIKTFSGFFDTRKRNSPSSSLTLTLPSS